MKRSLLISIDYDDTYTADPEFWDAVIAKGRECGHRFICVTCRRDTEENREEVQAGDLLVVFSNLGPKEKAVNEWAKPDIWIDDNPRTITEGH